MPPTAPETATAPISEELLALLIREHRGQHRPAYQRLWDYYRNELDFAAGDEHRRHAVGLGADAQPAA